LDLKKKELMNILLKKQVSGILANIVGPSSRENSFSQLLESLDQIKSIQTARTNQIHSENLFECRVKDYGCDSITGTSPSNPDKKNQDSLIMIKDFYRISNSFVFAVLDGHGVNGHLVSNYVKRRFPINLEQVVLKQLNVKVPHKNHIPVYGTVRRTVSTRIIDNMTLRIAPMLKHEVILEAFKMTNRDLYLSNIDIAVSGTTLVSVLIASDFLVCSNVGDSRAIIGSLKGSSWEVKAISHDHKPDSPKERKRITQSNGRVEHCVDNYGKAIGPSRVWRQGEDVPGLAMSRALGDKLASEVGVIAVPDIVEERISNEDKILIIASDGVWEYLTNMEAIEIVAECQKEGAEAAAKKLVRKARNKWENDKVGIDDITAIVAFFN